MLTTRTSSEITDESGRCHPLPPLDHELPPCQQAPAGTSAPAPFLSQSARVTCIPCGRGLSTVGSEGCRRWNCVHLHGREGCGSRPWPHSRVTQGALDPAGTPAPPQGSQPRTLGWGLGSVPSWFSVRPAAVIVPGAPWMFHHERVGHRWSSSLPGGRAGVVGCKVKVRSLAVPWGFRPQTGQLDILQTETFLLLISVSG